MLASSNLMAVLAQLSVADQVIPKLLLVDGTSCCCRYRRHVLQSYWHCRQYHNQEQLTFAMMTASRVI
jgi:hypothetical protein